jgi:hypothetical protein
VSSFTAQNNPNIQNSIGEIQKHCPRSKHFNGATQKVEARNSRSHVVDAGDAVIATFSSVSIVTMRSFARRRRSLIGELAIVALHQSVDGSRRFAAVQ